MNRFVRAAGTGALVWLGFELAAACGEKAWRFFVGEPCKYCDPGEPCLEHRPRPTVAAESAEPTPKPTPSQRSKRHA